MRRISFFFLIACLLPAALAGQPPPLLAQAGQSDPTDPADVDYRAEAQGLLAQMSPEQRVGQLFLVTFLGEDTGPDSAIADLIVNYHAGGVVLLAANDNIGPDESPALQVLQLSNALQRLALQGGPAGSGPVGPAPATPDARATAPAGPPITPAAGLPLFVALAQGGDGFPDSQVMAGLTEIPSQMAVGATWRPEHAANVGTIVGRELSAIGINMLLGPSLDVVARTDPRNSGSLGTRTFGGQPFWVGEMGRAYTSGVHQGSDGRLAVIAEHFPGQGASDRPATEEVPTVRKTLEALLALDLRPFLAVTRPGDDPGAMVDGLRTAHIRYQGIQGNISATTAPISFDSQALTNLLALPGINEWRQAGGLVVSGALGTRAIRRLYSASEQEFPHRQVAKDAFLAGNDLLVLSEFGVSGASFETQTANVRDTILWFQEKYETDLAFSQRVDESVTRILMLKLRLYQNDPTLDQVLASPADAGAVLDQGSGPVIDVAQTALTLLSPSVEELAARLPRPPGPGENIVIFTDLRLARQCQRCEPTPLIGLNALESRIMALYGPLASGQVQANQIQSFSFDDLLAYLQAPSLPLFLPPSATSTPLPDPEATSTPDDIITPTPPPAPTIDPAFFVQEALRQADWIIFAQMDQRADVPGSQALRLFLGQRDDLLRGRQVIVFAYGAPYYLDTTEISKVTAYYGVFSKIPAFIDVSVRALFQELPLRGASPVNIAGIGYDLDRVTQPDPGQIIELFLVRDGEPSVPTGEQPLDLLVGDTLNLRTGVIRDVNGYPVPDGTVVLFTQQDRLTGFTNVVGETVTVAGMAHFDYLLEARTGQFRLSAAAGLANVSTIVDLVIEDETVAAVAISTPQPTPTPPPTPTTTPTGTATRRAVATRTPAPTPLPAPNPGGPFLEIPVVRLQSFSGALIGLLLLGGFGLAVGRGWKQPLDELVRLLLWGVIAGLAAYNYVALGLPGAEILADQGIWAGFLTMLLGGLVGIAVFWWRRRS